MPESLTLAATGGQGATVLAVLGAALLTLAVLARISTRMRMSPIPLYILGGLALGWALDPGVSDAIEGTAELVGIVLLLFMLGIEYTGAELTGSLKAGVRPGLVDLVLNVTPGVAMGLVLGWDAPACLALGGATYISSSGIIAKLLDDLGRIGNRETPAVISVLVIEDLVMAFYLPILGVVVAGSALAVAAGELGLAVGVALLALIIAVKFGRRISRVAHHDSNEVLLLTVLGLVLLVAGVAEQVGVSAAVGAFLVGIALSGSVAERAGSLIAPLRDLFAAVFFVLFAISIDLGELPGVIAPAVALAVVTAITKVATGWYAARHAGVGKRGRMRAGVSLIARGEFSIVIAGLAVAGGVIPTLGPLVAVYVLLLALAGPLLARLVR
ncbi:MAG: cation:proton antiporter [Gaiellales bacterium]|nr:cation:proton antiporter [Gaiellales bacterium]